MTAAVSPDDTPDSPNAPTLAGLLLCECGHNRADHLTWCRGRLHSGGRSGIAQWCPCGGFRSRLGEAS